MKGKFLSFTAVLALLCTIVSCGSSNSSTGSNNNSQQSTQATTQSATEESTEQETESETEELTAETVTEPETEEVTTETVTELETEEVTTETVTELETEEPTESETKAETSGENIELSETSGGLELNYSGCTMTFPSAWKDRVVADGNGVYAQKCWENKEGTGLLFEISAKTSDELMDGNVYPYIVGVDGEKYIVAIVSDGNSYDTSDADLRNDYFNLFNDLQNIIPNAKCSTSPDFRPLRTEAYTSSTESEQIKFNGTWLKNDTKQDDELKQFVVFDQKSGTFGFRKEQDSVEKGRYWINTIAETYSEKGLLFFDGNIYKVNYTEDGIMNFERLTGQPDDLSSVSFKYFSDNTEFETSVCD